MGYSKELFQQLQDEFVAKCQKVEDGEMPILEAVLAFRGQKKECEAYIEAVKAFEQEHEEQILTQIEYNAGSYKGAKFEVRSGGRTFNFKGIREWQIAADNLKEIEDKYKSAFLNREKGLLPIDENGELLDLPEVSYRKDSIIIKQN